MWERRAELDGHAPLFYGIAHSGFPEPIQRRAELRSMRFFAEQMGWTWMGGIGFGGTSPIDGRPLDEAGMFSKQLRKVLPLAVADIAAGAPVLARDDRPLRQVAVPDAAQGHDRAGQLPHAQGGARQAARAGRAGVRGGLAARDAGVTGERLHVRTQYAKRTPSVLQRVRTAFRPDCAAVVMPPQLSTHWPAMKKPARPGWS